MKKQKKSLNLEIKENRQAYNKNYYLNNKDRPAYMLSNLRKKIRSENK